MVDFRNFAVYRTVDVDLHSVIDILGKGIFGNKKQHNLWAPIPTLFSNKEPTDLIEMHRRPPQSGQVNQSLFVIVDRLDWETEGLLVVNLNFKGYVDAIRQEVPFAGDAVPSINIGNTTWFESLCNDNPPLFPRKMFAVYLQERRRVGAVTTRGFEKEVQELEHLIQGGLEDRKLGSDGRGGVCVTEMVHDAQDLDKLKLLHLQLAKEKGYFPTIFALVDKTAWDGHSVLLLGVGNRDEGLRVDVSMVVELFQWIYVGLLSSDSKALEDLAKKQGTLLVCSGEQRD